MSGAGIPASAVEAAAEAVYGSGFDGSPVREAWLKDFRTALEAAAPYLMRAAWDEGWEAHGDWGGPTPNPYAKTLRDAV